MHCRQRYERERAEIRQTVACDVLQQLLPLADSFDSAFQQLKPAHGGAAAPDNERLIHSAYEALHKQLLEIFRWVLADDLQLLQAALRRAAW